MYYRLPAGVGKEALSWARRHFPLPVEKAKLVGPYPAFRPAAIELQITICMHV